MGNRVGGIWERIKAVPSFASHRPVRPRALDLARGEADVFRQHGDRDWALRKKRAVQGDAHGVLANFGPAHRGDRGGGAWFTSTLNKK